MKSSNDIFLVVPVEELRKRLLAHPLYARLKTARHVHIFMEHHVFAVWDFMTLVKTLQQRLTCVNTPWLPPLDADLARFINEIVVGEESDEDGKGGYRSHFELYCEAMHECGADTTSIDRFVQLLRSGALFESALHGASAPSIAVAFVKDTLDISATAKTHEIAAALVIGREDIIPDMFVSLIESLRSFSGVPFEQFIYYLNRHIQVDRDRHAPMARYLLEKLCSRDPRKIEEAHAIACRVLQARISFWDGILSQLRD